MEKKVEIAEIEENMRKLLAKLSDLNVSASDTEMKTIKLETENAAKLEFYNSLQADFNHNRNDEATRKVIQMDNDAMQYIKQLENTLEIVSSL